MKVALFLSLAIAPLQALPNAILGALAQHQSPLNGQDLTAQFLNPLIWDGTTPLPGVWVADTGIVNVKSSYLKARPQLFALDALLVRAQHREGRLEELQVTFADAGSFFGYLDRSLPEGLTQEEAQVLMSQRLNEKQLAFTELYQKTQSDLVTRLTQLDDRPKQTKRGRTRDLRAEFREFEHSTNGLVISLLEAPDRLLRLNITRKGDLPKSWLDQSEEELSDRDRLKALADRVEKGKRGDVLLSGVEIVPQGYRPYCGLNTLVMVARYLGLHLDEDWLAVAGKFQNTGSAAGSDMLGLYQSVAREARFSLGRSSRYDQATVRRSIQAGMPVIVWRRWAQDRDQLHSKVSRAFAAGGAGGFERVDPQALPSRDKRSPVHASVIIGFNDERREIIFLESWEGKSRPRRMPISEISKTADWTFSFQP